MNFVDCILLPQSENFKNDKYLKIVLKGKYESAVRLDKNDILSVHMDLSDEAQDNQLIYITTKYNQIFLISEIPENQITEYTNVTNHLFIDLSTWLWAS